MSLIATIKSGIDTAWSALGDIIQVVTYQRIVRGTYDPAAGKTPETVTATTLRVVIVDYDSKLINGTDIKVGDQQCILRAKDLASAPAEGDTILQGSVKWTVAKVNGDPRLYWDLTIRR